jgi:hypothetical protein
MNVCAWFFPRLSFLMIARACHPQDVRHYISEEEEKSPGAGRARADSVSGYSG